MSRPTASHHPAILFAAILLLASGAAAHTGAGPGTGGPYVPAPPSEDIQAPWGEKPCDNTRAAWRDAQTVEGVDIRESRQCEPDNPKLVAAFVKGTNHVPQELLDEVGLHRDAVVKGEDLDGDGDPDVIDVTLEVSELNGWQLPGDPLAENFAIAPGITPGFWTFHPKVTIHHSGVFFDVARMPSAPIRVEEGDQVRITLENTHYFPHTIHLHGVDHPFADANGEGNDGVPHFSEKPVLPGEKRTYELTPRQPGTYFYHCHVQPQVHVAMGLGTTLIVEENRENNTLQTFNTGGGDVRHPSKASQEEYDREYDLIYQDLDKELSALVQESNDPRIVAKAMNRDYDATDRSMDYFLVNGRSFPYTLRDSLVVVDENETVKLRVVNAGSKPVSLHTHGHKAVITHTDGVEVPPEARIQRDVYTLTAAQRLDLELRTVNDGLNSYGQGVWFMHDHQEEAVTNDGISPGGDITVIAYEDWLDNETSMPKLLGPDLDLFFTEEYYRGELPVWMGLGQNGIFGQVDANATASTSSEETRNVSTAGILMTTGALLLVAVLTTGRTRGGERE